MSDVTDESYHDATFEPIEEGTSQPASTETPEPVEVPEPAETDEPAKGEPEDKSVEGYKKLQKKINEKQISLYKEQQAREKAEQRARELEERLQQIQNPPKPEVKEEVLVEPTPPAEGDFDGQIKYATDLAIYNKKRNDRLEKAYNEEKQKREAAEYNMAHRQYWLGEIVKEGATVEEANKAYEKFIKKDTVTGKSIYTLYLIEEGKYKPPTPAKKKANETTITPPGVDTGGQLESLKSPDDEFNNQLGQANRYRL